MLESLRNKLNLFKREVKESVEPRVGYKLKGKKIGKVLDGLELILLESDVALEVVDAVKEKVKKGLIGKELRQVEEAVKNCLKEALLDVLRNGFELATWVKEKKKPVVVMFVGVNGSGKTTAIAKLAWRLKKRHYTPIVAASDTFRAGAIEQLEEHCQRLNVKLVKHELGSDPASVAYDAIEHAKAKHKDAVLIDTAGRMQTNVNLMDEMRKIRRVAKPDLVVFVGDALAGNDAVDQAKEFNRAVNIDMSILTKADADAKGGATLSIAHVTGKPIVFLGVGQGYEDLTPFNPERMVEKLLGEPSPTEKL